MIKKISTIILIAILAMILLIPTAGANVQSRPNATSLVSKTASEFFLLCRQAETSSGPLGLNATIEVQDSKVVETSSSNNIDAHMIKNTEYGTAAILSASSYGSCPQGYSSSIVDSTTGNDSGIKQMAGGKWEYVAGIYNKKNSYNTYIYNADSWHKNVYETRTGIPGDATTETPKWRGATDADFVSSSYPVFERSYNGVFSCTGSSHYGNAGSSYGFRLAVVCGVGL